MKVVFRLSFGLLILGLSIFGQADKGSLLGTVLDSSGAVLADTDIKITSVETSLVRTTKTNENGNFTFPVLDPGLYTVEADHSGFRHTIRTGVRLEPNSAVRVDFAMQLGSVTESVSVSANAAILQTDRSDLGVKIETQTLQNMPLSFNRNYQGLLGLVPGASRPFRPHSSFYNSQDSLSTYVNGQFRQASSFLMEGINNDWDNGNLTVVVPPIEAIQTVDVTTSNYDAEFGRVTGGVTNVVLRSGTNEFHGSVFEFNRVAALSAKNYFTLTKPPLVYNLFGGTFGGPIVKNKTFIFGDYQGLRDREAAASGSLTIPTMPYRAGNFAGASTTVYDPTTGNPDGTGRTPFGGNVIPANRISPIASKILGYVPPPILSQASGNYPYAVQQSKNTDSFDVKFDQQFSAYDTLAVRYSFQQPTITVPPVFGIIGGPGNGAFAGTGTARSQAPGLSYTHIFGPTLITQLRFGVSRVRNDVNQTDYGTTTAKDIGIGGANIDDWSSGMSSMSIAGFDSPLVGYSPSQPWRRSQTNFELQNTWTKITGNHTFKWGVDLNKVKNDLLQTQTFDPRGRFIFAAGQTSTPGVANSSANSFASFLLDVPNQIGRDLYVQFPTVRQSYYFFFAQDKWQVNRKLTLDLGVRYELWPAASSRFDGQLVNYDPNANRLLVGGYGDIPRNLGIKASGHWVPRVGLAYRLNEKTVIRSAFGISYLFRDTSQYNFPSNQVSELNSPNAYQPAGSMVVGLPAPILLNIPSNGIITNAPLNLTYGVMQQDMIHGHVQSWNLAIQREIPWGFTLDTAYVGNHGVDNPVVLQINRGMVLGAGAAGQPLNQAFGRRTGTTTIIGGNTHYHSLQVKANRRFAQGLMITTSYTYSKAIDYCSDRACTPYNQYDFELNRAASDFNRTHVFVQSFLWELPFGKGKRWAQSGVASWLAGGWQMNGVFTLQNGGPINITYSSTSLNAPFINNRPDVNGEVAINGVVKTGTPWFDTSKFSAPADLKFGNVGRNILVGPGLKNLDFSLFRKFSFTEHTVLEIRGETFNLSNTPHFNNPGGTFGASNFGMITSAQADSRVVQLGAKILF